MLELVDDYLERARQLLGTGHSPTPPPSSPGSPNPTVPETWTGGSSQAATTLGATLHTTRGQLDSVQAHTAQIICTTTQIPIDGHRNLNAIQAEWNSDKAALSPWANTAAGRAALLRAGQQRITETQTLITNVANRYGDAAAAVRAAQLGLPDSPAIAAADEDDPAAPRRRPPLEDELQSGTVASRSSGAPAATSAARPFTPPLSSMAPITAPAPAPALAPLTSSIPSAMSGLPSLAGAAPGVASPLLQPLSQIGSSSQTLLASARLSSTEGQLSDTGEDDPRSTIRDKIVAQARRALGLPYVWGGGGARGPSGGGFDCSGLTQFAVAQATGGQVILPRTTYGQIHCGQAVDLAHARPGDLVFSNFSRRGPEHVQIFAGRTEGGVPMVIEAQQRGVPVKFSPLSGPAVFRRIV